MHEDEIPLLDSVLHALIRDQFPKWGRLPIRRISTSGTVNAIVRIGEELAARFPLKWADPQAVRATLKSEAQAASLLAEHSPVPVPVPVAMGKPGPGYPLPWSVQTWLPGRDAMQVDPAQSIRFAHDLADFVLTLRAVYAEGRGAVGGSRGGDLRTHDAWMQTCFDHSDALLDVPSLRRLWRELRELPREAPDAMTHGDLMPGNVLVANGRLAGVLDTGGFGAGDPALDLIAGWHLLDSGPRAVLRDRLGCDDVQWARGKAWALEQSMGLVWYYIDTNPAMSAVGRRTLQRILNDSE